MASRHDSPDDTPDERPPSRSRRLFFKAFMGECVALAEEFAGRPQLRTGDLLDLPDERLATVIPRVVETWEIKVAEDGVRAHSREESGRVVHLFGHAEADNTVFNRFNGLMNIEQIARDLGEQMQWDHDRAFAHVRGLFMDLVEKGVVLPANSVW